MVHTLQRSIAHPELVACSIQHNLLIIYTVSTSVKTLELSVKYHPRKTSRVRLHTLRTRSTRHALLPKFQPSMHTFRSDCPQISEHARIVSYTPTLQNTPSLAANTPPSQQVLCFAAHAPTVAAYAPLCCTRCTHSRLTAIFLNWPKVIRMHYPLSLKWLFLLYAINLGYTRLTLRYS